QSLDRAVRKGWLKTNPARAVDLLREDKVQIDPLSLEEVKLLLSKGLQDDEDGRYFTVAFFSGLRPGEELGLQWEDLDWHRKTIATVMLAAGEDPGWVAKQLGHTSLEMVIRRYHRFIPNLTRRDGSAASRLLADQGL